MPRAMLIIHMLEKVDFMLNESFFVYNKETLLVSLSSLYLVTITHTTSHNQMILQFNLFCVVGFSGNFNSQEKGILKLINLKGI